MTPKEPEVIINGQRLTEGQSMTLRVALSLFIVDLNNDLGEDNIGELLNAAYLRQAEKIQEIMFINQKEES